MSTNVLLLFLHVRSVNQLGSLNRVCPNDILLNWQEKFLGDAAALRWHMFETFSESAQDIFKSCSEHFILNFSEWFCTLETGSQSIALVSTEISQGARNLILN